MRREKMKILPNFSFFFGDVGLRDDSLTRRGWQTFAGIGNRRRQETKKAALSLTRLLGGFGF